MSVYQDKFGTVWREGDKGFKVGEQWVTGECYTRIVVAPVKGIKSIDLAVFEVDFDNGVFIYPITYLDLFQFTKGECEEKFFEL